MPMPDFSIQYHDGIVAVTLPRRVDVSNTRGFIEVVQRELDRDRLNIVLDFQHTQAIDSTALGAIVQVFKTLRTRSGSLRLCSVGSGVRRVLAITRVDRIFPIHETLPEALSASAEMG